MTFSELRKANAERCEGSFHKIFDWSPCDWATAMGGECGEALNLIKKQRRGEDIEIEDIADELADLVMYIDLLSVRLGINLEEAVVRKFNKVSDRVGSYIKL